MVTSMNNSFKSKINLSNLATSGNVYRIFIAIGVIFHLAYTIIFYVSGIFPLVIYNICSIVLWALLYANFKVSRLRPILTIINAELLLFVTMTILYLGWNYKFYSYLYIMIPISLLSSMNTRSKTYNLVIACSHFIIMGIVMTILFITCNPADTIIKVSIIHQKLFDIISILHIIFSLITTFIMFLSFIIDMNTATRKLETINDELTYIATHDPLTSLINRRSMSEQFSIALEKYNQKKIPFSLIMADIDDFKKVNDIYGHDAGDIVLKKVARIIMDVVGNTAAVCRWGGEEMLILTYNDLNDTIKIAEEIRVMVQSTSFLHNGTYIKTTLTLGVAPHKEDSPINKTIAEADANLYKGKKSTKNCVVA